MNISGNENHPTHSNRKMFFCQKIVLFLLLIDTSRYLKSNLEFRIRLWHTQTRSKMISRGHLDNHRASGVSPDLNVAQFLRAEWQATQTAACHFVSHTSLLYAYEDNCIHAMSSSFILLSFSCNPDSQHVFHAKLVTISLTSKSWFKILC